MIFFSIAPTLIGHLASGLASAIQLWVGVRIAADQDWCLSSQWTDSLTFCRHSYHCMENVYEDSRSWFSGENHQEKITSPPVVNTMAFEMQNDNITIKTQTQNFCVCVTETRCFPVNGNSGFWIPPHKQFKPHDCLYTYIVNFVYTLWLWGAWCRVWWWYWPRRKVLKRILG